jgi:hypothetical protein
MSKGQREADEADLDRRGVAQRHEIEKVIEEEPADPEQPCAPGLAQMAAYVLSEDQPFGDRQTRRDGERHRHELEGRHAVRTRGEERQGRPQQNGDAADEGRARPGAIPHRAPPTDRADSDRLSTYAGRR